MMITNFLKTPVSAYNTESAQRTTKKKLLSSDPKNSADVKLEKATKDVIENDNGIAETGT